MSTTVTNPVLDLRVSDKSSAGTATSMPGARCIAIAPACARRSGKRHLNYAPRRSNAASSTTSTAAACGALGCAAGRTSRSAT